ncbi:MAG TPA: universal stress protein [Pyrinomonadaceae bacterium]|jgi:nucleotide-binding universal stress UspA family protein|nr:universal stress protein [Pyrinomonadaceae bacterium]
MINIKRILCPTDLSPYSGNAVRYALALARTQEAELILLHCTNEMDTEAELGLLETSLLQHLTPGDLKGTRWRVVVAPAKEVDEEIMRRAQLERVDLIVMRSRRRPHRAALLGSTAESVSRSAPCPVLVMHNDEREFITDALKVDLKRVLVAYDFSDYAELALRYGLSISQEHQAELHLLHVLPPRSVNEPEIAWYPIKGESAYHTAARRLQRVVPADVHLWCPVTTAVSEGNPYREILNYAEKNEIDLISVGAHGAGFGMRALFGSNVDRVLRQAPCPVLVARPLKPTVLLSDVEEVNQPAWRNAMAS